MHFSEKEIRDALFQIAPLKAPGTNDGYRHVSFSGIGAFFKEKIVRVVRIFVQTGVMHEGVNEAIIVLIPKATTISLCNVIYKIVAKCLVNRLRRILDEIISPF